LDFSVSAVEPRPSAPAHAAVAPAASPRSGAARAAAGVAIDTGEHRVRLKWHRLKRCGTDLSFTPHRLWEGMALGAAMEVDLRLHADHSFVCLHDETLDGETTGSGPVINAAAETLRTLSLRRADGTPSGESLLLLEDLAELSRGGGAGGGLIQLDLKETDDLLDLQAVANFRRTLASVAPHFILSGCDWRAVTRLAAAVPGLGKGFDPCADDTLDRLRDAEDFRGFAAAALATAPEAEMIYLDYRIVLAAEDAGVDLVGPFRAAGKAVDAWTLNPDHPRAAESLHRLVALQVDQITTDEPDTLQSMFAVGASR
jgi:glycerophosphoryl diester phosphodiesterase